MLGGIMGMMGGGGPMGSTGGPRSTMDELKGLMESWQGGDVYADVRYDSVPLVDTSHEQVLTDYCLI